MVFVSCVLDWKYLSQQIWPKKKLSVKLVTQTNSNRGNLIDMFIIFAFDSEYPFCGKFVPKNQNCFLS